MGIWGDIGDLAAKVAEVSFTVEDDIQLRGIGTLLLEELSKEALSYKITRFEARLMAENLRMLEVFEESGLKIEKRLENGVYDIMIDLRREEEYEKRREYSEHVARAADVHSLLYPQKVAVIGASRDPDSVGGALFKNILQSFKGTVFPVNPNVESIAGVLAYHTVLDIPSKIDRAVIAVPALLVPGVIDQCAEKDIRGAVIISAGFGESGVDGQQREAILKEKISAYGMRVIGPNCLGIMFCNA